MDRRAGRRTSRSRVAWMIGAVSLVLAGCEERNPGFCAPTCLVDARALDATAVDATTGCASNPVCQIDQSCLNDTCVDCLVNDDTESADCSTPDRPICGVDHACRPCTASSECDAPRACLAGRCVSAARPVPGAVSY